MRKWNYPEQILSKLKNGNIWKTSVINFVILNIIYLVHNIIENRGPSLIETTMSDQLFLLLYYMLSLILIAGVFKIFKVQFQLFLLTQYIFASSVLFSIIYLIDIPIIIWLNNSDILFNVLEFIIFAWISWTLIRNIVMSNKKYVVFLAMMCGFYAITIFRAILTILA